MPNVTVVNIHFVLSGGHCHLHSLQLCRWCLVSPWWMCSLESCIQCHCGESTALQVMPNVYIMNLQLCVIIRLYSMSLWYNFRFLSGVNFSVVNLQLCNVYLMSLWYGFHFTKWHSLLLSCKLSVANYAQLMSLWVNSVWYVVSNVTAIHYSFISMS